MRRALLPMTLLFVFSLAWPRVLRAWHAPDVEPVLDRTTVHPLAAGLARHQLGVWAPVHPEGVDRNKTRNPFVPSGVEGWEPNRTEWRPSTPLGVNGASAARAHEANPEWAFMGRTFLAWSAANLALREPARRAAHLAAMDQLIARTLELEAQQGFRSFLMAYGQGDGYVAQPARSLFVDGEVALMLALRRLVEDRPAEKALLLARLEVMEQRLRANPMIAAESYPDECWTFDHANALAAFRIADVLDGSDHSTLIGDWLRVAKARLVDPTTGLLVSSYRLDGTVMDGPEGSTIWLTAHALDLIDPAFAADQYARARLHLDHSIAGFWLAREWPAGSAAQPDIDSGLQLPLVEASPSSSAFALMAAANFGDREALGGLLASLTFAAFPVHDETGTHFAVSNAVGDSVILYALTLGPAWDRVKR